MSQISEAGQVPVTIPVDSLDRRRIGEILINAMAASALAGHARPASTMRDYIHPTSPEAAFVRDTFTRSTREIADAWYGGELEASASAAHAIADMLSPDVPRA